MNANSLIGIHQIQTLEQLSALAGRLAYELRAGDVILFSGNLGAGKTTFTQFLGKSLGVEGKITSPTYTLVGEYPIIGNPNIATLIHMDLYRMGEAEKKLPLNNEYIQEVIDTAALSKAVVVIEWAEKLAYVPVSRCWKIFIEPGDTTRARIVTFNKVQ